MKLQKASRYLRQARWLVEQAISEVEALPSSSSRLQVVQQVLGEIGGEYTVGETDVFADALSRYETVLDMFSRRRE